MKFTVSLKEAIEYIIVIIIIIIIIMIITVILHKYTTIYTFISQTESISLATSNKLQIWIFFSVIQ